MNKIFLVHGRNHKVKNGLVSVLGEMGIDVVSWEDAIVLTGRPSPYILDTVKAGMAEAKLVLVLFTPDDVVSLHPDLSSVSDGILSPQGQARPNVYLESGLAMGLDGKKVLLVEMGTQVIASDLQGLHSVRLTASAESQRGLATRLSGCGLSVAEDFDPRDNDERLTVPVFSTGLVKEQAVFGDSGTIRGEAPSRYENATQYYSVFPKGATNLRFVEGEDTSPGLVGKWAISRGRIRFVRGARSEYAIAPIDFSYILNEELVEKTLELKEVTTT